LTQYLLDSEGTPNMKVVVDEFIFSEWAKSLNFNVGISRYDRWYWDLNSDLKLKLNGP